jgi:hypothetical protein
MRCCSRARRWWHAPFLWLGQGERVAEVAIGEAVQWRLATAFERKKKRKIGESGRDHGQERRGGGLAQRVTCGRRKGGSDGRQRAETAEAGGG